MGDSEPCPHAVTCQLAVRDAAATGLILRNLLDACERGRPLSDIHDRLRVEVARLGPSTDEGTAPPDHSARDHHVAALLERVEAWVARVEGTPDPWRLVGDMADFIRRLDLYDRASGEGTAPPTSEQADGHHVPDGHGQGPELAHAPCEGPEGQGLPRRAPERGLWPPRPDDRDAWGRTDGPQPSVRRMADGLAHRLDRLHTTGNGVVPLVAATAFLRLAERAGLVTA